MRVLEAERTRLPQDDVGDLPRIVARFRWRLGFERLLVAGLRGLMFCAVALVGLSMAAWLIAGHEHLLSRHAWLVVLPLIGALGLALVRWPSERQAALVADRRLALGERLGTAVELAGRAPLGRFDRLQIRDAIEQGRRAPVGWLSLDQSTRREVVGALALGVLAAGALLLLPGLPRPRFFAPDQTGLSVDAAQVEAQTRAMPVDATAPMVDQAAAAPPPVAAPARAHADLATFVQQAQGERAALDALAKGLGQVSAGQPAANAIQQGDFSGAQQQLSNLGDEADQLSEAAKQQLGQGLQQAASTTTADRALADRERQAAQALGRSNYADQRQALRNLADQVERSGSAAVPADQLARDLGQLQQQTARQAGAPGAGGAPPACAQGTGAYGAGGAQGTGSQTASRPPGTGAYGASGAQGTGAYGASGAQGTGAYGAGGTQGTGAYGAGGTQGTGAYGAGGTQGTGAYGAGGTQGTGAYGAGGTQGTGAYGAGGTQGTGAYGASGAPGACAQNPGAQGAGGALGAGAQDAGGAQAEGAGAQGPAPGAAAGARAGQQAGGAGAGQGADGSAGQQGGPGVGSGAGGDPLGGDPTRLDSAGQRVSVPLMLGTGAGVRPPDGTEDQTARNPTVSGRSVAEQVQAQQTGQVTPETNLVPSEQRPVVRGYFQ